MSDFECEQTLLVQADFDGELDAGRAATLVEHLAQCPHCRDVSEQLARSRALLRGVPRYPVPKGLRDSVEKAVRAQSRRETHGKELPAPSRRTAWLGWATALAASVVLAVMVITPRSPDLESQLVASHVRSLQLESHLIDVPSSDHHTVRPWFSGKVDFAPLVKELGTDGYELKGGRVDIVGGRRARLSGGTPSRRGVHVAGAHRRGRNSLAAGRRLQRAALDRERPGRVVHFRSGHGRAAALRAALARALIPISSPDC